jgi:hypothetical protein
MFDQAEQKVTIFIMTPPLGRWISIDHLRKRHLLGFFPISRNDLALKEITSLDIFEVTVTYTRNKI